MSFISQMTIMFFGRFSINAKIISKTSDTTKYPVGRPHVNVLSMNFFKI